MFYAGAQTDVPRLDPICVAVVLHVVQAARQRLHMPKHGAQFSQRCGPTAQAAGAVVSTWSATSASEPNMRSGRESATGTPAL